MTFKDLTGIDSSVESWDRDESVVRALTLVLHLEKDVAVSHEEALMAAALAVRDYFLDPRVRVGGEWNEATSLWIDGRIRKLAKRARGTEWNAILELPGINGSFGKAEVRAFPPMVVDEIPKAIKKLQVQGLDLASSSHEPVANPEIIVAVNPDLTMTTGKLMAQVGHAVQVAIMGAPSEKINSWLITPPSIAFVDFNSRDAWDVEIHDAGFTEIEANSLTVKAQVI